MVYPCSVAEASTTGEPSPFAPIGATEGLRKTTTARWLFFIMVMVVRDYPTTSPPKAEAKSARSFSISSWAKSGTTLNLACKISSKARSRISKF